MTEYDKRVNELFYEACRCDPKARSYVYTFVNYYWAHKNDIEGTVLDRFVRALEHFEKIINDENSPSERTIKTSFADYGRDSDTIRSNKEGFGF